jgi:hypothetical protein
VRLEGGEAPLGRLVVVEQAAEERDGRVAQAAGELVDAADLEEAAQPRLREQRREVGREVPARRATEARMAVSDPVRERPARAPGLGLAVPLDEQDVGAQRVGRDVGQRVVAAGHERRCDARAGRVEVPPPLRAAVHGARDRAGRERGREDGRDEVREAPAPPRDLGGTEVDVDLERRGAAHEEVALAQVAAATEVLGHRRVPGDGDLDGRLRLGAPAVEAGPGQARPGGGQRVAQGRDGGLDTGERRRDVRLGRTGDLDLRARLLGEEHAVEQPGRPSVRADGVAARPGHVVEQPDELDEGEPARGPAAVADPEREELDLEPDGPDRRVVGSGCVDALGQPGADVVGGAEV